MKKLFFLGAVFAVGLGFTACSSDKDVADLTSQGQENGQGYVSLAISLPVSANVTRSTDNDQFDDGLPSEYTVGSTTLIFFDDSKKFLESYTPTISAWNKQGTSTDQITTVAKIVQSVTTKATDLYVLVVLNAQNLPTMTKGETTAATVMSTVVSNTAAITAGTMLMSNAPLAKAAGGSGKPSSTDILDLVKIAKENIYSTEAEAKTNPAAEVYVERIAAKVTVNTKSGSTTSGTLAYTLDGWKLDNYNTSGSLVRNTDGYTTFYEYYSDIVDDSKKFRMVGSNQVATGLYRIYWAKDANYDSDATTLATSTALTGFNTGETFGNAAYCFENTFDVDHQLYKNTTRVIMRLKFNDGEGFYTLSGDGSKIYLLDTSTKTGTKISDKLKEFLMNLTDVKTWLTDNTKSGEKFKESDITSITIAAKSGSTTEYEVTGIEFSTSKLNSDPSSQYTSWITSLNKAIDGITYYNGGYSYYTALIKHFGEDLTPWVAEDHVSGGAYADDGTAPVSRYLGRYGVLRNNWYDLNIESVKQIGSAEVPTISGDDTTDDVVKSYIAVKINILSWAKRTQNVNL